MNKDFDSWNVEKKRLDARMRKPVFFSERQIWWCKLGVNVGSEINGKADFRRPVLILRKVSAHTFVGIPLTRKNKGAVAEKGREQFYFCLKTFTDKASGEEKESLADFNQLRLLDSKRLIKIMYRMDAGKFAALKRKLRELF